MPTKDPTQHFENILMEVRGYVPNHALEIVAPTASGEEFSAGSLVSLNSSGEIVAGCDDDAMPLFARNGTDDFDHSGDEGNIEGAGIAALVATGGFEVYTTAFDTSETYDPNTLLTAGQGDDTGLVAPSPANYNDRVIVGCVSRVPKCTSETQYGQNLLNLWTMFIPKVETT